MILYCNTKNECFEAVTEAAADSCVNQSLAVAGSGKSLANSALEPTSFNVSVLAVQKEVVSRVLQNAQWGKNQTFRSGKMPDSARMGLVNSS